jgi:cellulose 1,4-beta-cellobiosidase
MENCALEGISHEQDFNTYHVEAVGDTLELGFVTQGPYSKNVGSRTFLMQDDYDYHPIMLLNREFTFTVDVSTLPCGLNGALYFVEMDQDGGK